MTLDTSSLKQLHHVEAKTLKTKVVMASRINETSHHTRSLTSEYLTRYLKGIAIKNFDNRKNFVSLYVGNFEWYVMGKDYAKKCWNFQKVIKEIYRSIMMT